MKTTQKLMTILTMLCMLLSALPGVTAQAMTEPLPETTQGEDQVPEALQEAILAASAEPFRQSGGDFTTQHNGVDYRLNKAGLQASSEGLRWGIALRGFGRGEHPSDVSPAEIVQSGSQLEYRRGDLTEWYRDTLPGVEQGFTIAEPPRGNGRLVLQLALDTDLPGSLDPDGRGISFAGPDGQTLRYDGLKVYDSNGEALEAKFTLTASQIVIRVDDRGAAYPVTIDPFIYLEQKVIAPDGEAYDYFGYSVALDGDTALVGAEIDDGDQSNQGSAYVFVRSGTTWIQQAKLTAADGAGGDNFGWSVALSGDTALVGAHSDDIGANINQGSAYVFTRSGTSWSQQAKLTAADGAENSFFGRSVALDGDTALVGAPNHDIGVNWAQGLVYIFIRSGTSWISWGKLSASDPQAVDYFGWSVALEGDTALVGAPYKNGAQGSAYVFTRGGWTWSQQAKLTALDGASGDYFGYSVALSEDRDTALVGAIGDDNYRGSAYAFTRSGTSWSEQAKLIAPDGVGNDYFGWSVALSGDTALVGAYYDDLGPNIRQGSAHIFTRSGSSWSQGTQLIASDGGSYERFGCSVALSGDTALVGAYYDDLGPNSNQGSAYFYQPHTDLSLSADFSPASAHTGDTVLLTLSAANFGPTYSAFDLSATAPLPLGLTYTASAATHGAYDPASGAWKIGMLPSGASATLTITATVVTPPKTLTFNASLVGNDMNPANNTASASLKVIPVTAVYRSTSAEDGWVLESRESSNKGGTLNSGATTLRLGDNAQKKQYRSVLSFATWTLPSEAKITKMILKVKKQGVTPAGSNPPALFQGFMVDVRKGYFGGATGLALNDFQVVYRRGYKTYGPYNPKLVRGWYSLKLTKAKGLVNSLMTNGGVTQVRLRFNLDDNNDAVNNYLSLFSGNAALAKQPKLIVQYYVPYAP